MFGPTMALKGSTDEAVKFAAAQMMSQQFIILKAATISITSLFIGACILSWANYPIGIAAITTVVYLIAYVYMCKEGYKAFCTFVPNEDTEFVEPEGANVTKTSSSNHGKYSFFFIIIIYVYQLYMFIYILTQFFILSYIIQPILYEEVYICIKVSLSVLLL